MRPWAPFLERPRVFCCRKNHLNRCPSSSCLTHPSHSIIMLASMDNDDCDDDEVSGFWGAASLVIVIVIVDDSVVSCRCPSSGVVRDGVVANETTAPHSSSSSFLNGSGSRLPHVLLECILGLEATTANQTSPSVVVIKLLLLLLLLRRIGVVVVVVVVVVVGVDKWVYGGGGTGGWINCKKVTEVSVHIMSLPPFTKDPCVR